MPRRGFLPEEIAAGVMQNMHCTVTYFSGELLQPKIVSLWSRFAVVHAVTFFKIYFKESFL